MGAIASGGASHGTSEFYAARANMTRRLIEEKGFCAVAAEADWPDAYRVNRYVLVTRDEAGKPAAAAPGPPRSRSGCPKKDPSPG
jgi:erythromycin esterase-like protein